MNETLMVRCKFCRRRFPTALQVDRASLEALVLNERYTCPHCRRSAVYVKADHHHVMVEGRQG